MGDPELEEWKRMPSARRPSRSRISGRGGAPRSVRPTAGSGLRSQLNQPRSDRYSSAQRFSGGHQRSRSGGQFWTSWSRTRKLRFLRFIGILVVLLLLVWQCTGSDDPPPTPKTQSTTPPTTPTTEPAPVAAQTVTATETPQKLLKPRYETGAALVGSQLVIPGGLTEERKSTDSILALDPTTFVSEIVGTMPGKRYDGVVVTLGGNVVLIGGLAGTTRFDESWVIGPDYKVTPSGKLPSPRSGMSASASADGASAYIIGGTDGTNPLAEVLSTSDGATFTQIATLAQPTEHPASVVLGTSLFVFGGEQANVPIASVQRVDLTTNAVVELAPLPVPLSHASAFLLGGSIFIAGGRTTNGRSQDIYRVDPITGAATPVTTLSKKLSDAVLAVTPNRVLLIGGLDGAPSSAIYEIVAGP
jgi:hypothetical protein